VQASGAMLCVHAFPRPNATMEEQHRKHGGEAGSSRGKHALVLHFWVCCMLPAPVSLHLRVAGLFRDWGRGVCFSWPLPSPPRRPVRVHVDTGLIRSRRNRTTREQLSRVFFLKKFIFTMPLFFFPSYYVTFWSGNSMQISETGLQGGQDLLLYYLFHHM